MVNRVRYLNLKTWNLHEYIGYWCYKRRASPFRPFKSVGMKRVSYFVYFYYTFFETFEVYKFFCIVALDIEFTFSVIHWTLCRTLLKPLDIRLPCMRLRKPCRLYQQIMKNLILLFHFQKLRNEGLLVSWKIKITYRKFPAQQLLSGYREICFSWVHKRVIFLPMGRYWHPRTTSSNI